MRVINSNCMQMRPNDVRIEDLQLAAERLAKEKREHAAKVQLAPRRFLECDYFVLVASWKVFDHCRNPVIFSPWYRKPK